MTDVFISYSHRDREFANRLVNALAKGKRDVWIDWQDIPRGEDWLNEIKSGIENADTFVLIISRHSLVSEVCNYEIAHAFDHNKRVIPVVLERIDGEIENQIQGFWRTQTWRMIATDNWQSLAHINWIFSDEHEFDVMFKMLIEAIETDYEYVKLHTRFQVRALEWQRAKENPSFLLRGDEIIGADDWLKRSIKKSPPPTDLHGKYILASYRRERTESRRLRNLRLTTAAAIFAVTIAIAFTLVASYFAFNTANVASTAQFDSLQAQQQVINANATLTQIPATLMFVNNQSIRSITQVAQANATLTRIPPTLNAIETEVALRENDNYSINLSVLAQEIYPNDPVLGLTLALEANRLADPPLLSFNTLAEIAYSPGPSLLIALDNITPQSLAYSPDGQYLIAGANDRTIHVWDTETGQEVERLVEHVDDVVFVAFSPDSQEVISFGLDGVAYTWDFATGQAFDLRNNRLTNFDLLRASSDLTRFLTVNDTNAIEIWGTRLTQPLWRYTWHDDPVLDLAISPVDDVFASTSATLTVVYDSQGRREILRLDGGMRVAFSPDGSQLLLDNRLYDIATGDEIRRYGSDTTQFGDVAFSPDGRLVLVGFSVWDSLTGDLVVTVSTTVRNTRFAFSPNSEQIALFTTEGIVVWDLTRGNQVQEIAVSDANEILNDVILSFDGSQLISSLIRPSMTSIQDVATGNILYTFPDTNFVRFSDYSQLWIDRSLYNLQSMDIVPSPDEERRDSPTGMLRSDGQSIVDYRGAQVWVDTAGNRLSREYFEGSLASVNQVAYSPDGTIIAAASSDNTIHLWTNNNAYVLSEHQDIVETIAFSRDGQYILSGSFDQTVILWNTATRQVIKRFVGHDSAVTSVAISQSSDRIVSSSSDGIVILWDVATGLELFRFQGFDNVGFSGDGRLIVSQTDDNTVTIWRNDSSQQLFNWTLKNRVIRELTCDERTRFNILPLCSGGITPLTQTPFPTNTPFVFNVNQQTTVTTMPTTLPTTISSSTPVNTPIFSGEAQVGDNRGQIMVGGGESWLYNGTAGDVIHIRVSADNPARTATSEPRFEDGFDTYLIVQMPDSSELRFDDIETSIITDSSVEGFTLPMDGTYIFTVRSWEDQSGGAYTLTIEIDNK